MSNPKKCQKCHSFIMLATIIDKIILYFLYLSIDFLLSFPHGSPNIPCSGLYLNSPVFLKTMVKCNLHKTFLSLFCTFTLPVFLLLCLYIFSPHNRLSCMFPLLKGRDTEICVLGLILPTSPNPNPSPDRKEAFSFQHYAYNLCSGHQVVICCSK